METVLEEKQQDQQICSRCVLDTTVPGIKFDSNGVCQYCKVHDELDKAFPLDDGALDRLESLTEEIKRKGKGKDYDIVVGVSGGRDSTYALYKIIKLGLRPLAVHFDNGWNSPTAVENIKNATQKLGVDLYTYVIDWEEFKDLQISFLKASVSDAEIPTDVGIHGILHKIAAKEGIKYVVFAHSFRTEGVVPLGWTYMDGRYIKSIQKKFGTKKLKTFPNMTLWDVFYFRFIKGIKAFSILAYMQYDKKEVDVLLKDKMDWKYYGGHHHESYYTHFFQSYYLPKKFNIDKRKIEYSGLICSGQITREEALKDVTENPYPYDQELVRYAVNKLGLTDKEFEDIMSAPRKSFHDYSTYFPLIHFLRGPIFLASKLNLFPKQLFLKFLS
jgi:N-acetyl sugar amidotransferase